MKKLTAVLLSLSMLLSLFATVGLAYNPFDDSEVDVPGDPFTSERDWSSALCKMFTFDLKVTDKDVADYVKMCKAPYGYKKVLDKTLPYCTNSHSFVFTTNDYGKELYKTDMNAFCEAVGLNSEMVYVWDTSTRSGKDAFYIIPDYDALGIPDEWTLEYKTVYEAVIASAVIYYGMKAVESRESTVDFEIYDDFAQIIGSDAPFNETVFMRDVNYDGRFNSKDILAAKGYLAGSDEHLNYSALDQDGNGRISSKDIAILKSLMS